MGIKSWREIQAVHSKHTPEQREATKARALRDLELERMTLAQLRRARALTQTTMAEATGMAQGDVSKLEHRADAYVGTVRRFVEALGGKLSMLVEFPDAPPVEINGFGDPIESSAVEQARRRMRRRLTTGKTQRRNSGKSAHAQG